MTETELLEILNADDRCADLAAAVRQGEYALWCRRNDLLSGAPDERLVLEVLLWAIDRILGDLEEHGAEHAVALYDGNDAAAFAASKQELAVRAAGLEPTSATGRALVAARHTLPPRERFLALQKALKQARRDGAMERFAAALADVESIPADLVSSWLQLLFLELVQVFGRALDEDAVAACEPVVRAFVGFSEGRHGELVRMVLRRSTGRQLARLAPGVAEGLPDRALADRLAALMAAPAVR